MFDRKQCSPIEDDNKYKLVNAFKDNDILVNK